MTDRLHTEEAEWHRRRGEPLRCHTRRAHGKLLEQLPTLRMYAPFTAYTSVASAWRLARAALPSSAPRATSIPPEGIEALFAGTVHTLSVTSSPAAIMMAAPSSSPASKPRMIGSVLSAATQRVNRTTTHAVAPLKVELQHIVVGATASALVEVFLAVHELSPLTAVYVPGLLVSPHHRVMDVFRRWNLKAVPYDLLPSSLQVDLSHLQRLVEQEASRYHNPSRAESPTETKVKALLILASIHGRFPSNAAAIRQFARSHGMLIVELHVPTVCGPLLHAKPDDISDLLITSLDAPALPGGAMGYAMDPHLAESLRNAVQRLPTETTMLAWLRLVRHLGYRLLSNRLDYGSTVWMLASLARARGWLAKQVAIITEDATQETAIRIVSSEESYEVRAMEWIYDLLLSPDSTLPYINISQALHRQVKHRLSAMMAGVTAEGNRGYTTPTAVTATRPHRLTLAWWEEFTKARCPRVDAEVLSLWSFLFRLPNYVEAVSAGESTVPLECVEAASSNVLLRAIFPAHVAEALRRNGYAAEAMRPVCCRRDSIPTSVSILPPSAVLYFESCPHAAAMATELVFVPLSPCSMKASAHRKLSDVIAHMPRSWFTLSNDGDESLGKTRRYDTIAVRDALNAIATRFSRASAAGRGGLRQRALSLFSSSEAPISTEPPSWSTAADALFREDTPWAILALYSIQALRVASLL